MQDLALEVGQSINQQTAAELYQIASALLSHISYALLALACVAATLLVYQVQLD